MSMRMQALMMLPAAAALAVVAGCTSTLPGTLTDLATQVREDALAVCSFVPTFDAVNAVIATFKPGTAIASTVADTICQAFNQQTGGATAAKASLSNTVTIKVNGVSVTGTIDR